jgi:signal transduction histidine kinase
MSPEVPYESRFFFVLVSTEGEIHKPDLSRIISVDDDLAKEYISYAISSKKDRGFVGQFRFLKTIDEEGTRILFLDCGRRLDSFRSFLMISVVVGLIGCIVVFIAFVIAAGRIAAPIAESYEKQKRFISDAGHEIKTPLTIINANVDLLELDGENEELTDIRQQTTRLTELTNNLIMLSKMEEAEHTLQKIEMPLSDTVSETAASFRAPAASRGLSFLIQVTPGITIEGSPDAIRQMVSVLLENAMKYSPEGGEVTLDLRLHRKTAVLSVTNTTDEQIDEKELQQVFDRFYRTDLSRNSQTGGHGIGLSIAKAIACAHGGSITAAAKNGHEFSITVSIPCR